MKRNFCFETEGVLELNFPQTSGNIRYVGDIWFVFYFLQLLMIRFTQQNSCCISKFMVKYLKKEKKKEKEKERLEIKLLLI